MKIKPCPFCEIWNKRNKKESRDKILNDLGI